MRQKLATPAFILLLLFATNSGARSQWVYTGGPNIDGYAGIIDCLTAIDSSLFAGSESMTGPPGTSITTDYGTTWALAANGLANTTLLSLVASGTNLFAGTENGLYHSTNHGSSWVQSGPTDIVSALAARGTNVFAGTFDQGFFLSTDSGSSWTEIDSGFDTRYVISALAVSANNLFAGTDGNGVLLSSNNGSSWITINTGLTNLNVLSLTSTGTNLYAGTKSGIFLSTNNGANWTEVDSGVTNTWIHAIVANGTNIFAGTDGGVFLSRNNGTSWIAVGSGITDNQVSALAVSGSYLFAGSEGVWRRPLSDFNQSGVAEGGAAGSGLRVFPNPASGELQIMSGEVGTVHLFDLIGRERMNGNDDGTGASLDVSRLLPGTYFLRSGSQSAKVEIAR